MRRKSPRLGLGFAERADRRERRGAPGGDLGREQRDEHTDAGGDGQRHCVDGEPTGWEGEAERVEHALEQPCEPDAAEQTERGGDDSDCECFERHGGAHLTARRTDGSQQCQLPSSLRDSDREGVVDAQGRDDEGDAREDDEERSQQIQEAAGDVVYAFPSELRAGDRLDAAREHRADPVPERVTGDTRLGSNDD